MNIVIRSRKCSLLGDFILAICVFICHLRSVYQNADYILVINMGYRLLAETNGIIMYTQLIIDIH